MAAAGSTPPRQVFRVSVPLDREMKREGRMGAVFRFTHCVHYRRVHSPPLFGHSIQSNQLWWIKVTLCHWNSTTYNSLFAEDFLLGGQGFVVKRVHCSGCHMARRSDAAAIFHCVSVISFVTRECHGFKFNRLWRDQLLNCDDFVSEKREWERCWKRKCNREVYKSEYSFYAALPLLLSMNSDRSVK